MVFPSTVNLWKSLYRKHGLQTPTFQGLEEYVFSNFTRLYQKLEERKTLVRPDRFHELRYEDLIHDPIGEMEKLYSQLGLENFDEYVPRLKEYLADNADYQTNHYELTSEQEAEIERRWDLVIRQYGYEKERVALPREAPAAATQIAAEMVDVGSG